MPTAVLGHAEPRQREFEPGVGWKRLLARVVANATMRNVSRDVPMSPSLLIYFTSLGRSLVTTLT